MRTAAASAIALLAFAQPAAAAAGFLESPDTFESGISLIYGWHCTARSIQIQVDNGPLLQAGSGTPRPDTASVCGHSDTGFGLTYNYNVLAPGNHTVTAYADGVAFAKRFAWTYSYGVEYLQGVQPTGCAVRDFPTRGTTTSVVWSEAKQNFGIFSIYNFPLRAPSGVWRGSARTSIVDTVCPGVDLPTATSQFDEGTAEASVTEPGGGDMRVQLTTPHGTCALVGQMFGSDLNMYMTADLSRSQLACLGAGDWVTVRVRMDFGSGAGFPSTPFESVLSISIRAERRDYPTCATQWLSFHGAYAQR